MAFSGALCGRLFYCPLFWTSIALYCRCQNTLEQTEGEDAVKKEVHEMKTYNLTRHLTTIITVFAAIFFLASCSI